MSANEAEQLAKGIVAAAVRAGITAGDVPLTGPQLLALCEDLATAALGAERLFDWLEGHWLEVYTTDEQGQPYRVLLNGTGTLLRKRIVDAMAKRYASGD